MRLIPDCIRDILLDIEECTAPGVFYNFKPTAVNPEARCSKYDSDTVLYHIKQCELNGYLTEVHWYMDRSCMVVDLTPLAHKFLSDIREDTNWNKTKEIAKSVGSTSMDAIRQIAAGVISSLIHSQLGL